MVRRCDVSPMALRLFRFNDVNSASKDNSLKSRTRGLPTSAGTSAVSANEDGRHFIVPLDSRDRIVRLPRDSVKLDHDYAQKVRPEICSRCKESLPEPLCTSGEDKQFLTQHEDLSKTVRSQLLGLRDVLFHNSHSLPVNHLHELLSLQADLLLSQQEKLFQKDRLNEALKKDKEQLHSRIERLERRISVLQKNASLQSTDSNRAQKGQSNSLLAESFQSPSLKRSMPHLNDSLSSVISVSDTPKRKYAPLQKKRLVNGDSFEEDHTVLYTSCYPSTLAFSDHLDPLASEERRLSVGSEEVNSCRDQDEIIITPGWKIFNIRPAARKLNCSEPVEDVSDEAFHKRHKKHEDSERRRKRWDNQRFREQRERENLLRRYRKVHMRDQKSPEGTCPKDQKLDSFYPPTSQVEEIHVMERLPVSAFGQMIPKLEPSPFRLPWFHLTSQPKSSEPSKT